MDNDDTYEPPRYDGSPMFEYKGYVYCPEKEYEEDNVKIFHNVTTPDGKRTYVKMSPYSYMSISVFQKWIDLGCPANERCNYYSKDIEELWEQYARRFINE